MTSSKSHISLTGHSGCQLLVRRYRGNLVTVKISKDADYNERLSLQAAKQKNYVGNAGRTPKIFRECINKNGLCEFHMEYIPGKTLAHHLRTMPLISIKETAEKLTALLQREVSSNKEVNKIFAAKLDSLEKSLPEDTPELVVGALTRLRSIDWTQCEESPCHGDLTLENIIVRDGELYLIDFLDSFYDSWMIDVATLLQDIECLWSYRQAEISDNLHVRLLALKNSLLSSIRSGERGQEQIVLIYNLLLLKLLRIIPYTKDEPTLSYLYSEIERLNDKIINQKI